MVVYEGLRARGSIAHIGRFGRGAGRLKRLTVAENRVGPVRRLPSAGAPATQFQCCAEKEQDGDWQGCRRPEQELQAAVRRRRTVRSARWCSATRAGWAASAAARYCLCCCGREGRASRWDAIVAAAALDDLHEVRSATLHRDSTTIPSGPIASRPVPPRASRRAITCLPARGRRRAPGDGQRFTCGNQRSRAT